MEPEYLFAGVWAVGVGSVQWVGEAGWFAQNTSIF